MLYEDKGRRGRNEPTMYTINISADEKNWGLTEEIRKTNEAGCSNLVQDKPAGWRHFNLTGSAILLKKRKTNA